MGDRISLSEKVKNREILKTGAKPKLPIKFSNLDEGTLEVYKIPIQYLYFNNENGRIASAISRVEHQINPTNDIEDPNYNLLIERMIIEDNPSKLKQTKKSIFESGQKVFGYVLDDGRVIDGNRRLTAIRQLVKETGQTFFFEAVILPVIYGSKTERAEIKRLELAIQMGTEERQSYDPVDLSVDIYHTIVVDELITAKDYAKEANISSIEINNRINAVIYMKDFLNFINAKENAFHIIKDTQLYNPLYEMAKKILKQYPKKGPEYELSKTTAFALLSRMIATGGETVYEMRDYYKEILSTASNNEFNNNLEEIVDNLRDEFEKSEIKSASDFRLVLEKVNPEIRKINEEYVQTRNRNNRGKNVEDFVNNIKEILNTLKDIEKGDGLVGKIKFSNFSKEQLNYVREYFIQINIISKELIDIYDEKI